MLPQDLNDEQILDLERDPRTTDALRFECRIARGDPQLTCGAESIAEARQQVAYAWDHFRGALHLFSSETDSCTFLISGCTFIGRSPLSVED